MHPQAVLETIVYCPDLAAGEAFYRDVVGLIAFTRMPPRHIFFRCGDGVLLMFNPDVTSIERVDIGGHAIPLHGGRGQGHVAFRVPAAAMHQWRGRLASLGVPIESEIRWPHGGESIYIRDPAGNSVEFATAAVWGLDEW